MTSSTKKYYCKFRINYIENDKPVFNLNETTLSDDYRPGVKLLMRYLNGKLGYIESILEFDPFYIHTPSDVINEVLNKSPKGSIHSINKMHSLRDHIYETCEGLNADPNKTSIEILVLTQL
ncbi:hypothetical protein [Yersinia phage vB_Yru_GN1]|uniref:Uncharacterized protein n=1 Tax=Yersinia phage vB_Yru_GN1 TaxID=3074381 RepID=A0AA86IWS0_9CAUD|nr:hypothetical protein [Yersinia phage vB_Yru_GN1]